MANNYHQLSLKDTFSDCKDMFMDDVPSFFQLLEQHFDISLFIPQTFYNAFYQHLGRKRDYPLTGFLSALILQKIFSIPTDSLLILLLKLCRELRDFCGFSKVPDAPLFTRFKLGFADHIELMFQQMVDYTEPICQQIDASLAQILTFDTSGIELYVTENNPKTLNTLIRKLKTYYKNIPDVDPYKMAYGLMPSQAASYPDAPSLAMKYCGITYEKGRTERIKWICPKVHMVKGKYVCDCKNPCSNATKGRTTYTYENLNCRMFPGIQRDSDEWNSLYKIRTIVERAIDHLKINMCVTGRKA